MWPDPWHYLPLWAAGDDAGGGSDDAGDGDADGADDTGLNDDNAQDKGDGKGGDKGGKGGKGLFHAGEESGKGDKSGDADSSDADLTDGDKPGKKTFSERPEWLPEAFYDPETGEPRLEALAKSQNDLRKQLGERGEQAPKSADKYDLAIPETLKDRVPDDDPMMASFREFAHEQGWSQKRAQATFDWYMKQAGELLPEPINEDKRQAEEVKKLGPTGLAQIAAAREWANGLVDQGVFNDADLLEIGLMADTAVGLRTLQKLRAYYGEQQSIPVDSGVTDGVPSKNEIRHKHEQILKDFEAGKISESEASEREAALLVHYKARFGDGDGGSSQPWG